MTLENADELSDVLRRPDRLGRVFARHAYGMRAWVDLFSARIPAIDDPVLKELVATLVVDNARHTLLFRERAAAHGVDPDRYSVPAEGLTIYERLDELDDLEQVLGYALGSLEHFDELLAVYAAAAGGADAVAIDRVRGDVARLRGRLGLLVGDRGAVLAAEAHERYRVRELAETPRHAEAA
jgi:hypothetical protein